MQGRVFMLKVQSSSSCRICRFVKQWIFRWGIFRMQWVGGYEVCGRQGLGVGRFGVIFFIYIFCRRGFIWFLSSRVMRSKSWLSLMEVSAIQRKSSQSIGLGIYCSGKGSSRREKFIRILASRVVSRVFFIFIILRGFRVRLFLVLVYGVTFYFRLYIVFGLGYFWVFVF